MNAAKHQTSTEQTTKQQEYALRKTEKQRKHKNTTRQTVEINKSGPKADEPERRNGNKAPKTPINTNKKHSKELQADHDTDFIQ